MQKQFLFICFFLLLAITSCVNTQDAKVKSRATIMRQNVTRLLKKPTTKYVVGAALSAAVTGYAVVQLLKGEQLPVDLKEIQNTPDNNSIVHDKKSDDVNASVAQDSTEQTEEKLTSAEENSQKSTHKDVGLIFIMGGLATGAATLWLAW